MKMITELTILAVLANIVYADGNIGGHGTQAPHPYNFGYTIKDMYGEQHREETGDGHNSVKGSYGYVDARGLNRKVDYVADHTGFHAQIKTNEPGTANQDPASVHIISSAPSDHASGYGTGSAGHEFKGAGHGAGIGGLGDHGHGNVGGERGLGHGRGHGKVGGQSGSGRGHGYNNAGGQGVDYGEVTRYDIRTVSGKKG